MAGALKQLKNQLKAVQNINKITSSMKAVSAAKFAKFDKKLRSSRPLGLAAQHLYITREFIAEGVIPQITLIALTSDRGLCGSMHAKVCKHVHLSSLALKQENRNYDIVCVGEKARAILAFDHRFIISLVINGIGHRAPTFGDASIIVDYIFKRDPYIQGNVVFPLFKNMAEFKISTLKLYTMSYLLSSKALLVYEFEDDDIISFTEFSQVSLMYYALCETFLVELAQRITAMSNASRNSKKMADRVQLIANRKRQQMITSDLIDIVSGAQVISAR